MSGANSGATISGFSYGTVILDYYLGGVSVVGDLLSTVLSTSM